MCNKISKCGIKGDRYFVNEVNRKTTPGQPNLGYQLFRRQD